jgi:Big-like domain-containing protein
MPLRPGLVVFGVLACGSACGSGSTGPSATVAKVVITPDSASIPGGDTIALSAVAQSAAGKPVSGVTLFWSTSDPNIATVSQRGVVTAVANGKVQIAASADNQSGSATIVVQPLTVASVSVSPRLDTIYATTPGNSVTITATTRDAAGTILTGQPLIWSATGGVANVSGTGVVTATNTAAGTATVTATSTAAGLPSASATVVVIGHAHTVSVSPTSTTLSTSGILFPTTVQLSVTITDTFGTNVTAHRTVRWTSSDTTVAKVSSSGLVTAVGASSTGATITATTTDGVSGSAAISVPY